MHHTTLAQLSLWATCVQAFYPYIPAYACTGYHDCGDREKWTVSAGNRRGAASRTAQAGEVPTFKLSQWPASPVSISCAHTSVI